MYTRIWQPHLPKSQGSTIVKPIVGIPNYQQVLNEEINENSRFLNGIGIGIRIKHIISGLRLNLSTKLPYLIFLKTEAPYNSQYHGVCTNVNSKIKVLTQSPHNVAIGGIKSSYWNLKFIGPCIILIAE